MLEAQPNEIHAGADAGVEEAEGGSRRKRKTFATSADAEEAATIGPVSKRRGRRRREMDAVAATESEANNATAVGEAAVDSAAEEEANTGGGSKKKKEPTNPVSKKQKRQDAAAAAAGDATQTEGGAKKKRKRPYGDAAAAEEATQPEGGSKKKRKANRRRNKDTDENHEVNADVDDSAGGSRLVGSMNCVNVPAWSFPTNVEFDINLPATAGPGPICAKCKNPIDLAALTARTTGKAFNCWICNVCNTRAVQVSRLDKGKAFLQDFKAFDPETQTEFWKACGESGDKEHLQQLVSDTLEKYHHTTEIGRSMGDYQPLSWYRAQG